MLGYPCNPDVCARMQVTNAGRLSNLRGNIMTRVHGVLRGLKYVDKSSTAAARFGRMFRWIPGEIYDHRDLNDLARAIVQREFAHFRGENPKVNDPPQSDPPVTEGPDVVLNAP